MGLQSNEVQQNGIADPEIGKDEFVSFTDTDDDYEEDTSWSVGQVPGIKSRCRLFLTVASLLVIGGTVTGIFLAQNTNNGTNAKSNEESRPTMAPSAQDHKPELDGSSTPEPTYHPSPGPTTLLSAPQATQKPSFEPTSKPTGDPTQESSSEPTPNPTQDEDITDGDEFQIVLQASHYLTNGEYVQAPNSPYSVGLSDSGYMVMRRNQEVVWQSPSGSGDNARLWMQSDGNVIIRNSVGESSWNTRTARFPGAVLVISNRGEMSVLHGGIKRWFDGNPRSTYRGRPSRSSNLAYPIRGTFYYPWYPATWTVGGQLAHFEPTLGFYSSSDASTAVRHIDELDYAHIDLSIASWWGPNTNLDKARITMLMDKTIESDSNLKWSLYHEDEFNMDQSPSEIRDDLNYIKKWFAWHDAFAHIDDRPVIFVYNEGGCDVSRRWMEASGGEFYIVLKLFIGYLDCPIQPDRWHQYGPATEELGYDGVSYSISPGFYQANHEAPTLDRVSEDRWRQFVQNMVDSEAPFQLLTTYNEYGEGTAIESSREWASSSGYGYYLDALHDIRPKFSGRQNQVPVKPLP